MYVKKSWSTQYGKKYITYQIVESYRPGKGKYPITRTLATITKLGKTLIDKITLLLKSPDSAVISSTSSFYKQSYTFGPIMFLYLFMKQIGIINCLNILPKGVKILLIAVILNRVLEPRSKLGSVSWIKKTCFPLLFGIDKDKLIVTQIYRAMDSFYNRLDDVLDNFFKQNKDKTVLLLYDITSIFFEGKGPEELATYGYSRDKRPDNPQILLCLVLNENKLPVYFDICEGNISDKTTVIPLINKLKKKFELKESIFIGDRGMVTLDNLELLEEERIRYIVALTHTQARNLIIEEEIQLELFDKKIPITIFTREDGGVNRRYILCGSEYRRQRDILLLEHLLKKGKGSLNIVEKMIERGKLKDPIKIIRQAQKKLTESGCKRFYDFRYEDGKLKIIEKEEAIKRARMMCGYYILQTTAEDLEPTEVETHYKGLKFVEEAFRELKDFVEIRPIFHWKDRRVKTHVFLCILAQTIVNKVRGVLKENDWLKEEKENSLSSFLDSLYPINVGIFEIEEVKIPIVNQLTLKHKELLSFFNMDERIFSDFDRARRIVD